jgi:putative membrane protein
MEKKGSFLARLIINAVAFFIVAKFYGGMTVTGFGAAIIAALIWGIINAILRPILLLLTLPVNILTFGLFTLVINGIILLLTAELYRGLEIRSFFAGILAAVMLSLVNIILTGNFVKDDDEKK